MEDKLAMEDNSPEGMLLRINGRHSVASSLPRLGSANCHSDGEHLDSESRKPAESEQLVETDVRADAKCPTTVLAKGLGVREVPQLSPSLRRARTRSDSVSGSQASPQALTTPTQNPALARWASTVNKQATVQTLDWSGLHSSRGERRQSIHPKDFTLHHDLELQGIRDHLDMEQQAASGNRFERLSRWYRQVQMQLLEENWVESRPVQSLIVACIMLNVAFIPFSVREGSKSWFPFIGQSVFILLFGIELFARYRSSCSTVDFFMQNWNRFDFCLMVMACANNFVLFFIAAWNRWWILVFMATPAFQIMRIGRFESELRLIIVGMYRALRAVVWSMILLTFVIYFCAVICTYVLSKADMFKQDPRTQQLFGKVGDAMFTLFTFATLEDYTDVVRHYIDHSQVGCIVGLCIVVFILFANLALLNLVTAVVVDCIFDVLPNKKLQLAKERADVVKRLEKIFKDMDDDGDKRLSLKEFEKGVAQDETVKQEMTRLQLTASEVKECFALIDVDGQGTVSVEKFIQGFLRMTGQASKKELLGVQYDILRMWHTLAEGQVALEHHIEESVGTRLSVVDQNCTVGIETLEGRCMRKLNELTHALDTLRPAIVNAISCTEERLPDILRSAISDTISSIEERIATAVAEMRPPGNVPAVPSPRASPRSAPSAQDAQESQMSPPPLPIVDWSRLELLFEDLKTEQRQLLAPLLASCGQSPVATLGLAESPVPPIRTQDARESSRMGADVMNSNVRLEESIRNDTRTVGEVLRSTNFQPMQRRARATQAQDSNRLPFFGHAVSALSAASPASMIHGDTHSSSATTEEEPEPQATAFSTPTPAHVGREPVGLGIGVESDSASKGRRGLPPLGMLMQASTMQGPQSVGTTLQQERVQEQRSRSRERHRTQASEMPAIGVPGGDTFSHDGTADEFAGAPVNLGSLIGPPHCFGDAATRVCGVHSWVSQNGWASMPLDRLILYLDGLGVELSVQEQDMLRRALPAPHRW